MILHEEIDRLPDRHRLPLVLCHLEEMDHAQAARQLHWSDRTLRRRLTEARERLRGRLIRRGLTGAGVALAGWLDARPASAAVPPAWAGKAVAAATGCASASSTAAALTARVLKVLSWTRLKGAATLVLALCTVVSIGILARTSERPLRSPPDGAAGRPKPAANQASARQNPEPEPKPKIVPDEQKEFRGLVLDPQGRPFTGAALILQDLREEVGFKGNIVSPRAVRARSGPDGRFRFTAAQSEFTANNGDDAWRRVPVVASAPGYGPDWAALEQVQPGTELTLRLVADEVPIAGRVLDLQGRPIAHAAVHVDRIAAPPAGDLGPFLDAWKRGDPNTLNILDKILFDPSAAGLPVVLLTGADGRFRLSGVGRERTVRLRIEAPDVEQTIVSVLTLRRGGHEGTDGRRSRDRDA